jgi:prepilin-type N-terminal cleavage/methylation domain-containing protein
MKNLRKQDGFTLIELLVVIAIIAILAISITIGYNSVRESAKNAKRIEIARSIATAEELYANVHNKYTDSISTLVSEEFLNSHPDDGDITPDSEGYVDSWENGRWDRNDVLRTNSSGSKFDVKARLDDEPTIFCCSQDGCTESVSNWWCGGF